MTDPRLNANPLLDEAHHRVPPTGFKYLVTEMVDKIAPFEPLAPEQYRLHVYLFSRDATELNKPEQELVQEFSVIP